MHASLAALVLAAPLFAADAPPAAPKTESKPAAAPKDGFKSDAERTLYAFGYQLGRNVGTLGLSDAEVKQLAAGVRDAALAKPPVVNMPVYLPKVEEMLGKKIEARAQAEKNKGAKYGETFAKDSGVKALQGGGWIKHETEGTGAQATADDQVKVHYRGTLIDGKEFDSSYKRGEPASFPLRGVIPCWTNGVSQMKVGGKAKLVCPSDVAYGDQGHPPTIPGGSTLLFDVELIEIIKPAADKTADKKN